MHHSAGRNVTATSCRGKEDPVKTRLFCAAALGAVNMWLCAPIHSVTHAELGDQYGRGFLQQHQPQGTSNAVTDDSPPVALPLCGSVSAATSRYRAGDAQETSGNPATTSVTNCVTYSLLGGNDPAGESLNFSSGYFFNLEPMDNDGNPCLGLSHDIRPWPFVSIANSFRGTLVRIAVQDLPAYGISEGDVLGEYFSSPDNMGRSPSRTTVDAYGNTWFTNRDEYGQTLNDGLGSVARVGLVLGGTHRH